LLNLAERGLVINSFVCWHLHVTGGYESCCGIELAIVRLMKASEAVESIVGRPRSVMSHLKRAAFWIVTSQVSVRLDNFIHVIAC